MSRLIKQSGDIRRGLLSQRNSSGQMEHFRHNVQEMQPIIEHVNELKEINDAPTKGNPNGWHYIGCIPFEILMDYLREHGITIDAFARNDDDCKTKFKKWFLTNRDLRKFNAEKC